ncbi:MAG: ATP-binding protein [Patescibacteria group bacterium]
MISDQITQINQTVLDCLRKPDEASVVKAFTEVGLKTLGADYGFVWLNSLDSNELELVYKTSGLPFEPHKPREGGRNYTALESAVPDFVDNIEDKPDANYLDGFIKSFVIIPLTYKEKVYGTMVLCFKNKELFSKEKRTLCVFIGNSAAQAITINRLVSKEHIARLASEQQEAYFRALIENSYEVIVLIDRNGTILYISPSVYKVFGHKASNLLGEKVGDFVYQSNPEKVTGYLEKIVDAPSVIHAIEFHYTQKDGTVCTMECNALNLLNNPHVKGIVLNVRDITEQKKAEILRAAQIQLKEEKQKNQFIANAAHEFRTPLSIIKGNAELSLREKNASVKSLRSTLRAINVEVDHLACLVSDMALLTNRIDHLQNMSNKEKVNLSELIAVLVKRVTVLAEEREIGVKFKNLEDVYVLGDVGYLDKLFINLIKNAIIYGKKKGYVSIEITKVKNQVSVRIEDNGIGISKDDLPHIFERFYRADKSRTGRESGTGLGLAIVKWIVIAHGGNITVESAEGEGTIFLVTLPTLN